jgi:predicted type IV restriction endonuclease
LAASIEKFAENLQRLINNFESDRIHYLSKEYPEAQARIDFITPFFKALGWDVENEEGLPRHEREAHRNGGPAE